MSDDIDPKPKAFGVLRPAGEPRRELLELADTLEEIAKPGYNPYPDEGSAILVITIAPHGALLAELLRAHVRQLEAGGK